MGEIHCVAESVVKGMGWDGKAELQRLEEEDREKRAAQAG